MGEVWRNWAGDQGCRPAAYAEPGGVDEVVAAVRRAGETGQVVRVAGTGHSFTPAVLTDGTLLSLRRMNRVLDVDRDAGLVRVQGGITLRELSERLYAEGLALPNLGDIDVQTVAGATATGTHGTGGKLYNISAQLHAIELVTADGTVLELDEESDPDAWRAARVSVGALGVVTAVTLRTVPAFTLEGVDAGRPLEETLNGLDELVDGNDHFEFYMFPNSGTALTRTNNRTDAPPRPRPGWRAWAEDVLLTNHAFGLVQRVGGGMPALVPALNRLSAAVAAGGRKVDRSYRVFCSPRLVRFTEMEYAIPREHAVEAARAVKEIAERPAYGVSFPIEVRFVAGDDALLGPAAGRDTCYIAVHVYRGREYEPYFREVEALMDSYGGRPHWGKRHLQTAETLGSRYPGWSRFAAVRDRLDPDRRFTNDYVRRVLG